MSFQRGLKKEGVEGQLFNTLNPACFMCLYYNFNVLCPSYSSEMIDGCRALLSIATVTNPVDFDRLLRSIRSLKIDILPLFAVISHLAILIHK